MKIVIAGMSGLVGNALKEFFTARGDSVFPLSIREDSIKGLEEIDGADAVINLSGASIIKRWSDSYKQTLYTSRINTTNLIVDAIIASNNPPSVLINASAVGIYDSLHKHDETSPFLANDFLGKMAHDWEASALRVQSTQTRVCILRFGVVYSSFGGAMSKMLPPFRLNLGGNLGDGKQIVSWIHLDDLKRIFGFVLLDESIQGVVNATSPAPLSNAEQTTIMAKTLNRFTFFPIPAFVVKIIFGEGSTVMLDSKEVYPQVLMDKGFIFHYPTFEEAMKEIASH